MGSLGKILVAGGLVLVTGPLSLSAVAQGYVDVEAERAAAKRRTQETPQPSGDSYGMEPAESSAMGSSATQASPSSSSSAGTQSIASPVTTTTMAPAPAAPVSTGGEQGIGQLFYQFQQLQVEVMRLNGIVEEQGNELRRLKQQSLERYVDLDRRLSAAGAGSSANGGSAVVVSGTGSTAGNSARELPGESQAYNAAYALVRGKQFDQAAGAFRQFLVDYPDGKYAPNSHYWLGELYLVASPQDLEGSRQSFMLLVTQYPEHPKVPDALYKLGNVHYLKGNKDKAREYLDGVIAAYGSSSAAGLAREFISQNY
jgi:tol-pal system protein YbgF